MSQAVRKPTVFMMDLWATVPYYTAYLSRALRVEGVPVMIGSITYYLDLSCFSSRGVDLDPGLLDIVGKYNLPRLPRRLLKLLEALINMTALAVRFLFSPPEIIHVQYLPMLRWRVPVDLWFVRLCRRRGSKIVLTVHDLLPHDTAERYKRIFHKVYTEVDALICHSDHVKHRLVTEFGIAAERISVIPHGPFFYDLPESSYAKKLDIVSGAADQLCVLWQGIIFPYKGLDLLVEAWKAVEDEIPNAWLVIAGTGSPDLLAELQEQVRRLDLKRVKMQLRFISAEELVALYRAASIVVYPYRSITTSGALATGLALGKTIVASNLPVFRELLHNDENALLVNPQKTQELSWALTRLARDPELRNRLSSAVSGMQFGDQSWAAIAKKTMVTYRLLHS